MEHLIGYTEPQPNTNQKRPWQGALADSHERACFVDICMIPPCQDLGKGGDFSREIGYNSINRIERNASAQLKLPEAWVTSWRLATMNYSSLPHSQIQPTDDPPPDFDTPAGRSRACDASRADRIVLALRYPGADDAEPIGAVRKEIAGRVYRLAVFDADVLAALVGMGWREGE